ncbi:unnamed protein product [Amoebophrya sp. A120]|nr:unnamed protein product [Amoebophrya sp. A120]|eukprot:GSA120T00011794001.1
MTNATADLTLYDILEVHHDADTKTITQQHRKQALRWHPDKHRKEDRTTAQKRFLRIQEAYEVLTSDRLRHLYDSFLDARWSGEVPAEMTWGEFRERTEGSTDLATGESVAEQLVRTKKERDERTAAPSLDDLRLLGYATGGFLLGSYLVYKLFLEEAYWLASANFWQSLEWAEVTLPLSFDLGNMMAMRRISAQLSALVKYSSTLGGNADATNVLFGNLVPQDMIGRLHETATALHQRSSRINANAASAAPLVFAATTADTTASDGSYNSILAQAGSTPALTVDLLALGKKLYLPYLGPFQSWLRTQVTFANRVLVKNFSTLEGYLWMD